MKQLAIGIIAHVDSGKTTLSEGMLYCAGQIKKLGRVDHGDTFLDSYELERSRGITIFSKQAIIDYKDTHITLLDTPGHVDFSPETERTFKAMDYAVLVISGTDGVQSHTETLWKLLTHYEIPTFIFVNKMDIDGADKAAVLKELKEHLSESCIDFSSDNTPEFYENAAVYDEEMLESFLENGDVDIQMLASAIKSRKIYPCCFGSALKMDGVKEFMDCLDKYTVEPEYGDIFGARVFKITEDEQKNRLTHIKITGGSLKVKAMLSGFDRNGDKWSEKINQIRIYSGSKFSALDEAVAGTVCAVTGLTKTYAGEGLGFELDAEAPYLESVLTYKLEIEDRTDIHTVLSKLRQLEEEEPELNIVWNEQLQEIHIRLMGEIQTEVLKKLIYDRFSISVSFGQGSIVYKETIADAVEGIGHYEPLRHYAEVHLLLEPGKRGSGLKFFTRCKEDMLDKNWQRLILTHLEEKQHIGVLTGSPITDMKITLLAGKAHNKHTEGGDFRQATYRAVRQGLKSAESILLEPWYSFVITVPTDNIGRAMADVQKMNGTFSPPETSGAVSVLKGSAPVSEIRDYHKSVIEYTRGKGRISCVFKGYEPCHNADKVIEEIGYDSDSDMYNPADSVFCSHGAGVIVKWNEVREHMHVDSGWSPVKKEPINAETRKRISDYCAGLADDKELMQIFEKTYGPVKRDLRTAMDSAKSKEAAKKLKTDYISNGPEYLLVDGYNIIFAWDELKELAKDNLDAARQRLINIMCNYQGVRQCNLILVFDAYKVKGNVGEIEKYHNITIVYTKEAETADMYIEKTTSQLGKDYRVRVATSDGLEQLIILAHGALRVSASEFKYEVDAVENAIREFITEQNT